MITIKHKGNFDKVDRFLRKPLPLLMFQKYGQEGVKLLSSATPIESGETAKSWTYIMVSTKKSIKIVWSNSHVVDGVSIAVILQYGHGTRNGGYVQGRDYINPAMRPMFDKMTNEMWKEVTK